MFYTTILTGVTGGDFKDCDIFISIPQVHLVFGGTGEQENTPPVDTHATEKGASHSVSDLKYMYVYRTR